MTHHNNDLARRLNPLIGLTPHETLENLCLCLQHMSSAFATSHDDPGIQFMAASVAAALQFEAGRLAA